MKKSILVIYFLIFLVSFLSAQSRNDIKNDALEARDSKYDIFIETNNGEILKFNDLKIKHPFMGYEYLEGDGKKLDISADSIKAFQTDKYYTVRIYKSVSNLIGKLPFTELFAQRLKNGKIELFMIAEKKNDAYGPSGSGSSSGYVWSYHLRKGKSNKVIPFSKGALLSMIQDNKSLFEEFENLYKRTNIYKSATTIIDEYN